MDRKKAGKSLWYLVGVLVVLLAGCLVAAVILYPVVGDLADSIGAATDLDRLTQVVMPGSAELVLARPGAYAVYYERHGVVDGVANDSDRVPTTLICSLVHQESGRDLPLVPDLVETNRYRSERQEREGVLFMSTTVDRPGSYDFSCRYPQNSEQPPVVLAFGPNRVWESIGVLGAAAGALARNLALAGLVVLVALLVAVALAVKGWRRPVYADEREVQ